MLSGRALNRATLARQQLLERVSLPAVDAIERLGGMQAQAPLAPYVGLWTRLQDFATDELSTLVEQRQAVRLHLMRNTVHLVSASDALDWRTLFYPVHAAQFSSHFRGLEAVDQDALTTYAKHLLEEQPRTRAQLARLLAERWPDADPQTLAYAATHHLAVCQVPPRGVWGRNGPAAWAPVESWLGEKLRSVPVAALVERYLGAFGPARVVDLQQWSGLTRLGEVVERMSLRMFRGEAGQVLYDLPEAPRVGDDIPAPPRFLPAYDNLLLSFQDRTRVILEDRPVPLPAGTGADVGTFLVDGFWQGTWSFRDHVLRLQSFYRLGHADRDALLAEAARLGAFLDPSTPCEIVLDPGVRSL